MVDAAYRAPRAAEPWIVSGADLSQSIAEESSYAVANQRVLPASKAIGQPGGPLLSSPGLWGARIEGSKEDIIGV